MPRRNAFHGRLQTTSCVTQTEDERAKDMQSEKTGQLDTFSFSFSRCTCQCLAGGSADPVGRPRRILGSVAPLHPLPPNTVRSTVSDACDAGSSFRSRRDLGPGPNSCLRSRRCQPRARRRAVREGLKHRVCVRVHALPACSVATSAKNRGKRIVYKSVGLA